MSEIAFFASTGRFLEAVTDSLFQAMAFYLGKQPVGIFSTAEFCLALKGGGSRSSWFFFFPLRMMSFYFVHSLPSCTQSLQLLGNISVRQALNFIETASAGATGE